tara:strand:+ start:61 stop:363 length:303 start_codon:yes stop_codon:yes gene_type:complete
MTLVIAYSYQADDHCISCTVNRYRSGGFDTLEEWHPNYNHGLDEHGVGMDAMDYESNAVHPIFSTDEWQEYDPSFLADNPIQYLACGDCHEVIEEYKHEE